MGLVEIRELECEHGKPHVVASSIPSPWCRECEDTISADFTEFDELEFWNAVMLWEEDYISEEKASELCSLSLADFRIARKDMYD